MTCDSIGNYVIKRQSQKHIILMISDSATMNIHLAFRSGFFLDCFKDHNFWSMDTFIDYFYCDYTTWNEGFSA